MKQSNIQQWEEILMQSPLSGHEPPSLEKILSLRESRRRRRRHIVLHFGTAAACFLLGCVLSWHLPARSQAPVSSGIISEFSNDPADWNESMTLFSQQYEDFTQHVFASEAEKQLQSLTASLEETQQIANWTIATFNPMNIQEEK